jgi:hypothetical protein
LDCHSRFQSGFYRFFLFSFYFPLHSVLFATAFLPKSLETLYLGWQYTALFIVIIPVLHRVIPRTNLFSLGLFPGKSVQRLPEWSLFFSFVFLCRLSLSQIHDFVVPWWSNSKQQYERQVFDQEVKFSCSRSTHPLCWFARR